MSGRTFTTTVSINGEIDASVQKAFASMAERLSAVQKAAVQASSATDKLSAVIDMQSDELEAAKKAYTDYILSGEKSRKKTKELAANIKNLASELDENEQKLIDAKEAAEKLAGGLKKTGDSARDSEDGFTVMRGAAANLVATGITAITTACIDAVKNITGLAESTREYREDMSKLKTSFETLGHTAKEGTAVYKELYSVFGEEDRAVEAAQQIAALADNQDEMARMVDIATGAWARWGDSLATESLMEAMNSTAKIGTVQGTLADALEWSGVNLDEFNASLETMNSEEQRSAHIMKTLEKLYGKAADDYRENNASIIDARKANSDYTDTVAKMGEIIEPITTRVQEGFTLILQKIIDLVSNGDVEAFGEKIDVAFDSFINDVLPRIISAMDWIANNTGLLTGIAVAIGVIATAVGILNIAMAIKDAMDKKHVTTLGALIAAQWAQATSAMAVVAPYLLIVAAIAAVIAIIVLCVKYWDQIKAAALSAVQWIVGAWNSVATWMNETVIQPIANFFTNLWNGIKLGIDGMISFFVTGFSSLAGIVKAPINAVVGIVNGAINAINAIGFEIPDWVPVIGGSKFSLNIPLLPTFATGGFTDGISIAGEDPRYPQEAIISFNPAYRSQNLSYWAQAGRMLGADTADYSLGGAGGGSYIDFGGITFAPQISVSGKADKESIMEAIEAEYPEFIDMLEEYFMQRSVTVYA